MIISNEYQISPLKGFLKNKIVSEEGPETQVLATAMKFGFISEEEFEVLQAIKQKKDIQLSSTQLQETLKRLTLKNLVEKVE